MTGSAPTYSSSLSASGGKTDSPPVRVAWEHEECTARTLSVFPRLARAIERAGCKHVILDMTVCKYVSVSGLRHLIEWHADLARQGVTVYVSGLSPFLARVFTLAKLEWIIADTD